MDDDHSPEATGRRQASADYGTPTADTADGTYSGDSAGIREAAAARDAKLAEHGPTPVDDGHDDAPDSDVVEIFRYDRDGNRAGPDKTTTLRESARDLQTYREREREQARQAQAELLDDEAYAAEQPEQQQPEQQQARPEQAQQRATPEQAQQLYEIGLATTLHQIRGVVASEFQDIRSIEQLAQLQITDPARFARFQQLDAAWQGTARNAMQAMAYREHEQTESFKKFAADNDERAAELIPEARGSGKAQFEEAALDMLKAHGFERAELQKSWSGKDTFSLRDARVQSVVADATRWRTAQSKAHRSLAQQAPPAQRPGVAGAISRTDDAIERLSAELGRTGSLKAAIALRAAKASTAKARR